MSFYKNKINYYDPRERSVPLGQYFPLKYDKFNYLYKDLNYYYYYNPNLNYPFSNPLFPNNTIAKEIKTIDPMTEQINYFYIDKIKDNKLSPLSFLNDSNFYRTDIMSSQINFINKNKQFIFR